MDESQEDSEEEEEAQVIKQANGAIGRACPAAINHGAHHRKDQEKENKETHEERSGDQPSSYRGGQEGEGSPTSRPRTAAKPFAVQTEEPRKEEGIQGCQAKNFQQYILKNQ